MYPAEIFQASLRRTDMKQIIKMDMTVYTFGNLAYNKRT